MIKRFNVSDKELLLVRNKIFLEFGIPELTKNGFVKSPFSTSLYGRNNLGDFTYYLSRLSDNAILENLTVYISKGDRRIKIFLNIFKLLPDINSVEQLKGYEGTKYHIPPSGLTRMRLRGDEYKGPPLFRILFCPEYIIGKSCSKTGFDKKLKKLAELIKKDMKNIDYFVKKWHELHQMNQTDWEGNMHK